MRHFGAFPGRGISYKWLIVLTLFTLSLALTGAPQGGAFAQAQQQTATQQPATPPQQAQPEIALIPVDLVSPIERAEKDGTALRISLRDLTKLALQSNLDIAIADTNEEVNRQRVISARASYDPTMTANFGWSTRKSLNKVSYDQSQEKINSSLSHSWGTTLSKKLPTGSSFTFTIDGGRQDTNSTNALANPAYSSSYSLRITQQLLRDFRNDSTRTNIKLVNLDVQLNDSSFLQSVTGTIARVQQAYWDLISVIRSYDISRKNVELARITVANNQKKVEIGTSAPIDVTSSKATQASREVDLISAAERILSAQNSLKQLISSDRNADIWGKMIVPTDSPDFVDYNIELNTAIETALKNRPELESSDVNIAKNDLNYKQQQNSRKWGLSLTGSLSGSSVGVPQGNTFYAPKLWGAAGTSYLYLFNTVPPSWGVSMSLDIPLSHKAVDTQLAQTRIAKQVLLMQRSKTEQSIIVEIRNAVQALNTAKQRLQTAAISRQLSEAQLDAENKRFAAGLSQNYLVLQRQGELASSQLSELNANITYRKAIITLQQAMYTLLDANDVSLAKGSSAKVQPFK
jgi:outer membrane protein